MSLPQQNHVTAAVLPRLCVLAVPVQDLVGKNLTYLSQLDGLGFDMYRDSVLPRMLEQVVSCRDDIAQQYLMQAIIQVGGLGGHLMGHAAAHMRTHTRTHTQASAVPWLLIITCSSSPTLLTAQVFPDAFHLGTLGALLDTLPLLQPGVKVCGLRRGCTASVSHRVSLPQRRAPRAPHGRA